MNLKEEYCLSEYQDLGRFNTKENMRLKRHKIYGTICVEKKVSPALKHIYDFLKDHPTPYIPEIYECILDDGVLVVMEEYVQGRNLEDMIREKRPSETEAVRIALELCSVLKILHNEKPSIICRDIKAENVMVDKYNRIKLVDFDIARTFQEGKKRDTVLMGTAEYAAPEQFGYFQTDSRTDIYALGVLINYMVTGKFPVEEMVQGRLSQVVKKSTYLDPKERYQTAEEVEKTLKRLYPECVIEAEKSKKRRKSFTLPGFRSGIWWKKMVAVIGYFIIAYVCFSAEMKSTDIILSPWMIRYEQTVIWLSQMVMIGVICNYRGWRDEIPFLKNGGLGIRIAGYIVIELVLIFFDAFLCVMCEQIFL